MTRPSQARGRRGLKAEAEQLARRGRPPKDRPPGPAPAPGTAPATAPPALAGAPPEEQGKQFGLVVRGITAPLYKAVCGAELPPAAWEEWGVSAAKFAAFYAPAIALHPGYQFVASSAVLAAPLALAWPAYLAQRRAQLSKAKAEAAGARRQGADGTGPESSPAPRPPASAPGQPPRPGHSVGGGWSGAPRE